MLVVGACDMLVGVNIFVISSKCQYFHAKSITFMSNADTFMPKRVATTTQG
jgi:hypothetical protein